MIIYLNSMNNVETTITKPEVFAPKGNMLDLISINYYRVVLT